MIIWNLALVSSLMFLSLEVKYDENTGKEEWDKNCETGRVRAPREILITARDIGAGYFFEPGMVDRLPTHSW